MIEKICPKCGTSFFQENKKGYGRTFCSRSCANSRVMNDDVKVKISVGSKKAWNNKTDEQKLKSVSNLLTEAKLKKEKSITRLMETDTEYLGHGSRKRKVFLEQDERCNKCGIRDWNGQPLSFELEHIDGNKHNNIRENLEVLCPNCHSQTK